MKQVGFDTEVLVFEKNDTKCKKLPKEFPKSRKITSKSAKSAQSVRNQHKMQKITTK
jgi:hypothetical protein